MPKKVTLRKKSKKLTRKNKKVKFTSKNKRLTKKKVTRKNKKGGDIMPNFFSSQQVSSPSVYNNDVDTDTDYNVTNQGQNNMNINNSHITEEDKQSIENYWKNQYSNARDGEELSEYDLNEILDFLDAVTFNPNYTSSIPSDDIDPTLFTSDATEFKPEFSPDLNPDDVSPEYVALCNQANDSIEAYLFVTGRFE